ncbi:hypothetical protein, partial [Actinoplanes couchii]|uniref:hypothetical protein n=1 Tax=Actinoplanes couchii TaxID=403638 RepID=UPI001940F3E9
AVAALRSPARALRRCGYLEGTTRFFLLCGLRLAARPALVIGENFRPCGLVDTRACKAGDFRLRGDEDGTVGMGVLGTRS